MLIRKMFLLFFIAFLAGFFSCTKKSDEISEKENSAPKDGQTQTNDPDFSESDEDILSVDYTEFYQELSPHGQWIQVSAEELGLELKKAEESDESGSILDNLIGIRNAYADIDFGMFFVWKPSPDLAVTVTAGEPAAYIPYTNGQWIYTDAGWYFKAPTPYEETTCHYGRWVYNPAMGWVWVPGKVWAPAWVEWRENESYIAWAPIPPSVYIVNNSISSTIINENHYTVVEKKSFMEPSVYKYRYQYVENKNKIMIKEMTKIDGIMIKNKTVINKGPEALSIEKVTGKKVETVKVKKVKNKDEVKYAGNEISVYTPSFDVKKEKRTEAVSKPEKFVTYQEGVSTDKKEKEKDVNVKKSDTKGSEKDKVKGTEKINDKGNKKLGDDRGMKNEDKLKEQNEKNKKNNTEKEKNKVKGNDDNKNKGNKNKGKK